MIIRKQCAARLLFWGIALSFFVPLTSFALLAQQAALLINENDPDSMALANQYGEWRGIPPENYIYVDVPQGAVSGYGALTAEEFDEHVLHSAQKQIKLRGLDQRILFWIYSSGFPPRINASTPVSLQGYTLARGNLPEKEWILQGRAVTSLFLGIEGQGSPESLRPAIPFRAWQLAQGTNMPLPSMMLSHLGTRGLTFEQALVHLKQGVNADGTTPTGKIFFEDGEDVRARARAFQFSTTAGKLKAKGLTAEVSKSLPNREPRLLGVFAGQAMLNPAVLGTFIPGAYADHLTSFGALFTQYHQMKCTAWLQRGATATSGTIVEPMAIWTKFPSARLFEHYADGLSMIESLFGATACPFQTLFLGDPLSRPYQTLAPMIIIELSEEKNIKTFQAHPVSNHSPEEFIWQFSLDGRPLGPPSLKNEFELDTRLFSDGYHRLDAEAIHRDNPMIQGRASTILEILNRKRWVKGDAPSDNLDSLRPARFTVEASEGAKEVGLRVQGRLVATEKGDRGVFNLTPKSWGEGPVRWQAVAFFDKDIEVRGELERIESYPINSSPVILGKYMAGEEFKVETVDPDEDEVTLHWWRVLEMQPVEMQSLHLDHLEFTPIVLPGRDKWIFQHCTAIDNHTGIQARFHPNEKNRLLNHYPVGLVFEWEDDQNFSFFGFGPEVGCWIVARQSGGLWRVTESVGMPLMGGQAHTLEARVLKDASSWVFLVNDEILPFPKVAVKETSQSWGLLAAPDIRISDVGVKRVDSIQDSSTATESTTRWRVSAEDPFGGVARQWLDTMKELKVSKESD